MIFIKYLCLVIAIMYGFSNFAKIFRKSETITVTQIILMSVGIVGYIAL